MPDAGKEAGACVWPSTLRKVVTTAIADAERAGMTGRTRDEWVSIAILASPLIPIDSHFPTEGGGPCPRCCATEAEVEALAEVMTDADCASSEYPFSDRSRARAVLAAGYRRVFPPAADLIERACEVMHDAYEAAAVDAGWETQQRSRKPWADVPEANKATMRAAVAALLAWLPTRALPPAPSHEHDQAPANPADGDTFTCDCGYSAEFVVLDDGLPGEWVSVLPPSPREGGE